jgi:hypothetical protein
MVGLTQPLGILKIRWTSSGANESKWPEIGDVLSAGKQVRGPGSLEWNDRSQVRRRMALGDAERHPSGRTSAGRGSAAHAEWRELRGFLQLNDG